MKENSTQESKEGKEKRTREKNQSKNNKKKKKKKEEQEREQRRTRTRSRRTRRKKNKNKKKEKKKKEEQEVEQKEKEEGKEEERKNEIASFDRELFYGYSTTYFFHGDFPSQRHICWSGFLASAIRKTADIECDVITIIISSIDQNGDCCVDI